MITPEETAELRTFGPGNGPTRHGRILGETLAAFVDAGRRTTNEVLPDLCATCAFRAGSLPNQVAGTGLTALNTMLEIDPDDFACHHGMKEGQPTKLCKGYLIAKLAPFDEVKAEMARMLVRLDAPATDDDTEDAFSAWHARVDPERSKNVYELAILYAKDFPPRLADPSPNAGGGGAG